MSDEFVSITSDRGWIGRIGWWNTFDQHWSIPSPPPPWLDLRIWGKAPVHLPAPGWGLRKLEP